MRLKFVTESASSGTGRRNALLLSLAIVLMAVVTACSSGGSDDPTATPVGSGQVPVENPDGAGRPESPILTGDARRGLDSYTARGCSDCHSGVNTELGPDHLGVYAKAAGRVSGLSADEYITQSLRDPGAFIVPGFDSPSVMPAFDTMEDDEIADLIAYLKTLVPDEPAQPISVGSLPSGDVEQGRNLYGTIGCSGCHSLGPDRIVGPGFKGVGDRAGVRKAGLSADEYLVESIREPAVFIVEGFPKQMPAYDGLSDQEIANLLAFLKSID